MGELRGLAWTMRAPAAPAPGFSRGLVVRRGQLLFDSTERARTKAALAEKRARGERISGTAPFGFKFKGGQVVPVPREQPILKRMLQLHECGNGAMRIAGALNDEGLKHPRTRRRWNYGTVRSIVKTALAREA